MKKDRKKIFISTFTIFILFTQISIMAEPSDSKSDIEQYNNQSLNKTAIDTSHDSENEQYRYIIITQSEFKEYFSRLIEHKNRYLNSKIFTLEEILINDSFWATGKFGDATNISQGNKWIKDGEEIKENIELFNDTAAKIRNFIRFAYEEYGTEYVLLGGDNETIPTRKLYVITPSWFSGYLGSTQLKCEIPSDMYFGCLNGSWNDDSDEFFGEQKNYSIADEADFYNEVYIGRAPVDNVNDVLTFVNKVISYETSIKPQNVLLHQSNLRPLGNPDTTIIPNNCKRWIPENYQIFKLYQDEQSITKEKWIKGFTSPEKLLILHVGNGYQYNSQNWWYQLNYDLNQPFRVKFGNEDVYRLRNNFFPIHLSVSCLTGNFCETDCIAEELLLWNQGGPSAGFFNSEVGAVEKDDAHKYSGEMVEKIFYELFSNNTSNLGRANAYAKYHFVKDAITTPNYRICIFEMNLLGDPETPFLEKRERINPSKVFVDDDFNQSDANWNITQFNSIQSAIDTINLGGQIHVFNGVYPESISLDKSITLIGEDKNNTVIISNSDEPTITLNCNSSVVKNFKIMHNSNFEKSNGTIGIYIKKSSWGNEISDSIIINNSNSGIYLEGACRTYIHNNRIRNNGKGIEIVRSFEMLNNIVIKTMIITCYNVLNYNDIQYNKEIGVYLEGMIDCEVAHNNILNNGFEFDDSKSDAAFEMCKSIRWFNNYWGEDVETKNIHGTMGPIIWWKVERGLSKSPFFYLFFPTQQCKRIYKIGIPVTATDDKPANEPFLI